MDGGIIMSEIARVNIVILKSAAGLRNNAYPTAQDMDVLVVEEESMDVIGV